MLVSRWYPARPIRDEGLCKRMMQRTSVRSLFAALLAVFLAGGCLRASPQVKPPTAFANTTTTAELPAEMRSQGMTRARAIAFNLELFEKNQTQTVRMNFFDDVHIAVNWTQVERVSPPAGFLWTGTTAGSPAGRASMVISGKSVTGTVTRGDGWIYEIRTTADGRSWVREVDQKKLPQEAPPPRLEGQ